MPDILHKKVLLIGFQPDISISPYFRGLFGTAEEIGAKLDADHARIQRAGITPIVFLLNQLEKEKGLKDLEVLLREGKYDAIGIGAGVRLNVEHTALFETMVNMCRTITPSVPLMFNDGPGGSAETLERVLGVHIP
ncbi:hypothetical protein HD806DRAFT_475415 [Xylariaceae sp. AK1471]|nr:hypothetical protein HD806DRAFT_475415 [Xylariaceae sp. AK1471]